jgi:hypothetical protein
VQCRDAACHRPQSSYFALGDLTRHRLARMRAYFLIVSKLGDDARRLIVVNTH